MGGVHAPGPQDDAGDLAFTGRDVYRRDMPARRLAASIGLALPLILIIGSQSLATWLVLPVGAAVVVGVLKIDTWLNARWERTCLLADCDRQHTAYLAGDDDLGLYGIRPQPPVDSWAN